MQPKYVDKFRMPDGTIVEIGSDKFMSWGDIDGYGKIEMTKVKANVCPSNEHAQGLARDNTYLYMASMASDSANATISKVRMSDMSLVKQTTIPVQGHLNTLNYHKGKLYGTAGKGSDYSKVAVIDAENFQSVSLLDIPFDAWNFALIDSNGVTYAAMTDDSTVCLEVFVSAPGGKTLQFNRSARMHMGAGINNGFFIDQDFIYQTFAAGSDYYQDNRNILCVNTWGGHNYWTFLLTGDGFDTQELEDIAVVDRDGVFYVNDHDGNIWRGSLKKRLKTNYKTSVRTPSQYSPNACIYNGYNGTETWANKILKEFRLQANTYLGYMTDIIGSMSLGSYRFPVCYEPETGTLHVYGSFLDGYTPMYVCLWYEMTSDDTTYKYTLSQDSWVASPTVTTKGDAIGSLAAVTKKGTLYMDHLTGLFGANPEYKFKL